MAGISPPTACRGLGIDRPALGAGIEVPAPVAAADFHQFRRRHLDGAPHTEDRLFNPEQLTHR